MSECAKPLLVISMDRPLSSEARENMTKALELIAQSIGAKPLILSDGLQAGIHSDIRPLLTAMLEEQKATNRLLAELVAALAEEGQDPDAEPVRYLDGSKVR